MANEWQNIAAKLNQKRAKSGAIWQNDYFSQMTRKSLDSATFDYDSDTGQFAFANVGSVAPMGDMWNQYKRLAESRGIIPDYMAFMQQYQTMKITRNSKILDRLGEKSMQYSGSSNYNENLKREIKTNPQLRDALITALRENPEHAHAPTAQAILTEASTPTNYIGEVTSGVVGSAMPWIPGLTPASEARKGFGDPGKYEGVMGPGGLRTVAGGLTLGAGMLGGKGFKEAGKKAMKPLIPGYGIKSAVTGGLAGGKGGFSLKNDALKKQMSKITGIDWGAKNSLSKMAVKNPKAFQKLILNMEKKMLGDLKVDASKAFNPDGTVNKKWMKNSNLTATQKTQIKSLGDMKKASIDLGTGDSRMRGTGRRPLSPKYVTDEMLQDPKLMKRYTEASSKRLAANLKKGMSPSAAMADAYRHAEKILQVQDKSKVTNLKKTINRSSKSLTSQFNKAVTSKGGTKGFIKWVFKNYSKTRAIALVAKLGLSATGKALSGATGGISGAASFALDAWTLYEISDIIADALKTPKSLEKDAVNTKPLRTSNISPVSSR